MGALVQRLGLIHQLLRLKQQDFTCIGQARTAAGAVKQLYPQVGFQQADGGAHCRLCLAQLARGLAERTAFRRGHKLL